MQYHDWPHGKLKVTLSIDHHIKSCLEAGKPKRERDEIVVGKWVAENHATYAATKNVVKRSGQAKPTVLTVEFDH